MRTTCSADMFCVTICCHFLSLPFSGTLQSRPSNLAPLYISRNNVSPSNLLRVVAIVWLTIFMDFTACNNLIGLCHQLQTNPTTKGMQSCLILQTIVVTPILHTLHQQTQLNSSIIVEMPLRSSFSRIKHEICNQLLLKGTATSYLDPFLRCSKERRI